MKEIVKHEIEMKPIGYPGFCATPGFDAYDTLEKAKEQCDIWAERNLGIEFRVVTVTRIPVYSPTTPTKEGKGE